MNQNSILDDLEDEPEKEKSVRPLAIVLEVIPCLAVLFGPSDLDSRIVIFIAFPLWYLLLSWYFFKASKFKILDIIIAELWAIVMSVGVIGILFTFESWPGAQKVMNVSMILGMALCIYLLYRFITKRDEPLEYRFSLKLFSRIFLFCLLLASLTLYSSSLYNAAY